MQKFFPFLGWLPLAKKSWKEDLIAGITGAIIVIPQAVAFAIIAGLPPIYGFYTAIITPVVAALFGSSYHLISGPTTAISLVVYATLSNYVSPVNDLETFISLAMILTFLTGLFQFLMGVLRMGKLANFVSYSVVIGFTAGAGLLIVFKQLKHILGLDIPQGSALVNTFKYIGQHTEHINIYVAIVAISTLGMALLIHRFLKPLSRYYMLIAMVLGSVLALFLGGTAVGIVTVGEIPSHLPVFDFPELFSGNIKKLSSGALILAVLGLIEAVAVARSIALSSHQRINTNQEFIGQGLSNLVASCFSGYAGSGSFTRSGVNYRAGAKTPLSAIFSAFLLVLVVLFFAKYASYLPKAVMGGIIVLVGFNLINLYHIKQVIKSSKRELLVLAITFFSTLFFELEFALLAGILTSLFFYLERTSKPHIAILGLNSKNKFVNRISERNIKECSNLKMVRIGGSLYFGSIEVVADFLDVLYDKNETQNLLIVSNGINFIDLGAAEWLTNEVLKWQNTRGGIYFTGMRLASQDVLRKGGFIDKMGGHIFFKDKNTAITEIHKTFDRECQIKAFIECYKYK